MNTPIEWNKAEEWSFRGKDFMVQIRHWTEKISPYSLSGPNRWAVYAYIYPNHPHFSTFGGDGLFQSATEELPLHGGASYVRTHYRAHEEIVSIQVGADYNHDGDAHFGFCDGCDQALEVFMDAGKLYRHLQAMAEEEAIENLKMELESAAEEKEVA